MKKKIRIKVDSNAAAARLAYPCIVAWGEELGSFDYYINNECYQAHKDAAPSNAVYRRDDGTWVTTSDLKNPALKTRLESHL